MKDSQRKAMFAKLNPKNSLPTLVKQAEKIHPEFIFNISDRSNAKGALGGKSPTGQRYPNQVDAKHGYKITVEEYTGKTFVHEAYSRKYRNGKIKTSPETTTKETKVIYSADTTRRRNVREEFIDFVKDPEKTKNAWKN